MCCRFANSIKYQFLIDIAKLTNVNDAMMNGHAGNNGNYTCSSPRVFNKLRCSLIWKIFLLPR